MDEKSKYCAYEGMKLDLFICWQFYRWPSFESVYISHFNRGETCVGWKINVENDVKFNLHENDKFNLNGILQVNALGRGNGTPFLSCD